MEGLLQGEDFAVAQGQAIRLKQLREQPLRYGGGAGAVNDPADAGGAVIAQRLLQARDGEIPVL